MKTITIPEQMYDVPNWIYWMHTHPKILLIIIGIAMIGTYFFIKFYLSEKWRHEP